MTSATAAAGCCASTSGTTAAARIVAPKTINGVARNTHEACSASTTRLRSSFARSRYGCQSAGAARFCMWHLTRLIQPASSGALTTNSRVCSTPSSQAVM